MRDNLPELTLEEKVLIGMDTMDIPKQKAGQYLVDGMKGQEFKMLEAEKKKAGKKVMGSEKQPP